MQEIERSRLSIHPAIRHPYNHASDACARHINCLVLPDSSVKFNGSYGSTKRLRSPRESVSSFPDCGLAKMEKESRYQPSYPEKRGLLACLLISCFIGRGYNACLRPPTRKFACTRGGSTRQHVGCNARGASFLDRG